MLPSIIKDLKPYQLFSNDDYVNAKKNILKHKQSTIKFNTILESAHDVNLNGDYTLARISHNYFNNCIFDSASLEGVAGTGCIFNNNKFLNTKIINAGFSSSTIEGCFFENCKLNNSNMSQCYIDNTILENCDLRGLNLSSSYLKKCKLSGELAKPGNMNETFFDSTQIENVRFTNINLEYAFFNNMKMNNVILPFSQIPYIFGGIDYLLNTKDNTRISSHINKMNSISIPEYIDVLKDMEVFYSYNTELFPLSNILLSLERKEEALYAALAGMVNAAKEHDYRMCKNFARLITYNRTFSPTQLRSLNNEFEKTISIKDLNEAEFFQYNKHINEIRSILTENSNRKEINLYLTTNIANANSKEAGLLIELLDEFTHLNGVNLLNPKISISHNSPLLLCVTIGGISLAKIIATSGIILATVAGVCKSMNEIAEFILKIQKIRKNKHEYKDYKEKKLSQQEKDSINRIDCEINNIEQVNPDINNRVEIYSQAIKNTEINIDNVDVICNNFNIYQEMK